MSTDETASSPLHHMQWTDAYSIAASDVGIDFGSKLNDFMITVLRRCKLKELETNMVQRWFSLEHCPSISN